MTKPRTPGRPRIEDREKTIEALAPWVPLGMSKRTWYRRQAEKRAKRKSKNETVNDTKRLKQLAKVALRFLDHAPVSPNPWRAEMERLIADMDKETA
jgi:hypothetical protein